MKSLTTSVIRDSSLDHKKTEKTTYHNRYKADKNGATHRKDTKLTERDGAAYPPCAKQR